VRFGRVVAESAEASGRKIGFVASADQGHAHDAKGPYGFNLASAKFDEEVRNAVLKNDLTALLSLPPQFIEDAKPDSLWQLAMLQGILNHTEMVGRLLSYQVPTYFGLLCAVYLPKKSV
jgi:aromatic ring-opening dioxygenase LigB subunit